MPLRQGSLGWVARWKLTNSTRALLAGFCMPLVVALISANKIPSRAWGSAWRSVQRWLLWALLQDATRPPGLIAALKGIAWWPCRSVDLWMCH